MAKKLIHCLTNKISINDCANIILAAGASPIMAEHPAEVADITGGADALYINLGNISDTIMASMRISAAVAVDARIPIVIDPAGIGCSDLRIQFAKTLLRSTEGSARVIKCNLSEASALLSGKRTSRGVDTEFPDAFGHVKTDGDAAGMANKISTRFGPVSVITGKIDRVASGGRSACIDEGSERMSFVTGTGCMLGAYIAVRLAAECLPKQGGDAVRTFDTVKDAVETYALGGRRAALKSNGPGSFKPLFFDEIYGLHFTEGPDG